MQRREFLQLCGGLVLMSGLPISLKGADGKSEPDESGLKNIQRITIPVGATAPFKALHISDSHLTRSDSTDNERKRKLAVKRKKIFKEAELQLAKAVRHCNENNMLLLHSGDLIDFVTDANLEYVKETFAQVNCFASVGNHEFSQYVGEAKEDAAYKAQNYDNVQKAYPNDITFASRVINGVNFIAIDDVYYNFTDRQLKLMKKEVKKGLPIVMLCHVPLYTEGHREFRQAGDPTKTLAVTGAPAEITDAYPVRKDLPDELYWKNTCVSQKADKPTLRFINWLKKQPELKAILCGHLHYFHQSSFSPTATQYIVGAGYNGNAYEIEFV